MKAGLIPALVIFGAVALGLFAIRDRMNAAEADGSADSAAAGSSSRADSFVTHGGVTQGGRSALLKKEADGHYWTTAYINGTAVRFMVDTGASVIALTERDARRVGLDLDNLPRDANVSTAAGRIRAASAVLDEVTIERVSVDGVQAVVIEDGLDQSLLGMSFLNRMDGWDVTPRAIVIRQ